MREKECYCVTCDKEFNSLGIARHRAMHRDRRETCTIVYKNGEKRDHAFNKKNIRQAYETRR